MVTSKEAYYQNVTNPRTNTSTINPQKLFVIFPIGKHLSIKHLFLELNTCDFMKKTRILHIYMHKICINLHLI